MILRPLLPCLGLLAMMPLTAAEPIALFDGTSLDDWEVYDMGGSGDVEMDAYTNDMIIHMGEMLSGAIYKKAEELPTTNYEITLEAKRLDGVDFFVGLTFPVGDLETCATLVMGGWGGSVTGISSIDNMDAANNATGTFQRYADDTWYKVRLRVTPKNLSTWIDGKQVIDQDIEGREVSVRAGSIEAYLPLSLTTFNTRAAIRNVVLTPLEKEGDES